VNARARLGWPRIARILAWQAFSLAIATVAVALLEASLAVREAWAIYLLAVAWVAIRGGSWAAAGTAIGPFLLYNFLFVPPQFTFRVATARSVVTLVMPRNSCRATFGSTRSTIRPRSGSSCGSTSGRTPSSWTFPIT
jgi:K+-sensing histidine kinase KdpD